MKTLLLELSCDSFGERLIVVLVILAIVVIITILIFLRQGLYIVLETRLDSTHRDRLASAS